MDTATRDLLLAIANRLTTVRPDENFTEARRLALALRYATQAHGDATPEADAAEEQLLIHMPRIDGDVIRSEYAVRLSDVAKGL